MQYRVVSSNKVCWENLGNPPFNSMILPYRCFCLRTENRARKTHVFWGGGGACQRSLYFVHYSGLRCKDLWCCCYVTWFYAADGVGLGWGGMSTFLVLRTSKCATLQRSVGSLLHYLLPRCRDLWCCCYVTWFYAADGVGWGWGGMSRFLVLRTLKCATLQRSVGSLLRYLLLRCYYRCYVIYLLLRCCDLWDRCWLPADCQLTASW